MDESTGTNEGAEQDQGGGQTEGDQAQNQAPADGGQTDGGAEEGTDAAADPDASGNED